MLPDFPKTKESLMRLFVERIKLAQAHQLGIFSGMKQTKLFEGAQAILHRDDGSSKTTEMREIEATAEMTHDLRELETLGVDKLTNVLDTLGQNLATEKIRLTFKILDEAVREVGNVSDANKPMVEQIFEMLEMVQLDFTPDGRLIPPQLIAGSDSLIENLKQAYQEIQTDRQLTRRYYSIIERKKQVWRDREAARNLVE